LHWRAKGQIKTAVVITSGFPSPRLESVMEAAHGIAKAKNLKMSLIKFTNRLEIEDIAP
jgi:hypothetical protein